MKNNIKAIRLQRGITQAILAKQTGVGIPQVSKWENGLVDIPTSRLAEIAAALGVQPGVLLDEEYVDVYGLSVQRKSSLSARNSAPSAEQIQSNALPVRFEGASEERLQENLPIYGSALGASKVVEGEAIEQTTLNTADVVQYAKRPTILNGNASAYGLYVAGSSMEPRHMDGDLILVDPKGRVRGGEDVVVYLRSANPEDDDGNASRAVLVKRLLRRTSTYVELEQFLPAKVFRIEMSDIVRIDRVIPWQELIG